MRLSIVAGAVLAAFAGAAVAQTGVIPGPINDAPLTENWAPTQWGADDKAGSANHTKNPANIKRALTTIKQYKAITIGKYYHREAPAFGARSWQMTIPGTPTGGPFGKNALIYHDELLTTEIGQIQTQFDGPGHIGVNTSKGPFIYNGRITWDAYERGAGGRVLGMGPLGVEHVGENRLRLPPGRAGRRGLQEVQGPDPGQRRNAADPEEGRRSPASSPPTTSRAWSRRKAWARSGPATASRCTPVRATPGATTATSR